MLLHAAACCCKRFACELNVLHGAARLCACVCMLLRVFARCCMLLHRVAWFNVSLHVVCMMFA